MGDAQVWIVHLAAAVRTWATWGEVLSGEEVERMRRFVRDEDRLRFGVTRAMLRRLLASHVQESPESLCFATSRFGRPRWVRRAGKSAPEISFSVSHSGDYALLGFALRRPVGVDVEHMRPGATLADVAATICGEQELQEVRRLTEAERPKDLYTRWTLKEAYSKALGLGLSFPPAKAVVARRHPGDDRGGESEFELHVRGQWTLDRPIIGPGYCAAVVVAGASVPIQYRRIA